MVTLQKNKMTGGLGEKQETEDGQAQVEQHESAEEGEGKLGYGKELMHSVMENDQNTIDQGKLLQESVDRGMGAFNPDAMMEKFVQNYRLAKKLMGETVIRRLSGYSSQYVEKNIKIPEFQRELHKKMTEHVEEMKESGLLEKDGQVSEKGMQLSALTLLVDELDNLTPQGRFGEHFHKKHDMHGMRIDTMPYKRGARFRDLAIKSTIKQAVRRGHTKIQPEDLRVFSREAKGEIELVYALDVSASMKGEKLSAAKRAGIALAHRAMDEHDKVGLVVFGDQVHSSLQPQRDFVTFLRTIAPLRAAGQTNFAHSLFEATKMFSSDDVTKHILVLTDAMPTAGDTPERDTLRAVSYAASMGVTVSLVGLGLEESATEFAQKIVEIGNGKLYFIRDLQNLDKIILEDYYSL